MAWTFKRSRERTSEADRQAAFSYEFDYSLAQMETDIKAILNVLRVPDGRFQRSRCFTRVVMVFDELDKLENPVEQLNNVITHFKNFFTLSDALFVFITDQEFYEHLSLEGMKAQKLRQYSTEHTFFTNRIYLRKPEFEHFYGAVYGSCEKRALIDTVAKPSGKVQAPDSQLLDYLLKDTPDLLPQLRTAPLATITQLMLSLNRFPEAEQQSIEEWFRAAGGAGDPLSLATLWAGVVGTPREPQFRDGFIAGGGWHHTESVALLYYHRTRFSHDDIPVIEKHYLQLKSPSLKRYESVDLAPFGLTDIARALCFQSRNHYFDLFYLIHDYVGSYQGGVPILHINEARFAREQRLWSRYQQMVEAAFRYRREDHPSREYWNAQLMETLYAVFDSRLTSDQVKAGSLGVFLVDILLKLERHGIIAASRRWRKHPTEKKMSSRYRRCGASRGCSEAGRQRGLFTQHSAAHRFQAQEVPPPLDERSSSGPTEEWLHRHDLAGEAREITRAKKLYGLARYHSRTE